MVYFVFSLFLSPTVGFSIEYVKDERVDTIAIDEVISLVNEKYVKSIPLDKLMDSALLGLMHSVDDYSDYFSPSDYKDFQSAINGTIYGIGIEFCKRDGNFIVVFVFPNSPAERAGILPNDVIISVNNLSCERMSLAGVMGSIRGAEGTNVKMEIGRRLSNRNTETIKFALKRSKLTIKVIKTQLIDKNILLLKISAFSRGAYKALLSELKILHRKGKINSLHGIILDLRDNPGGLLDQAVDIAGFFLPNKAPIVTVHTKDSVSITNFLANSANSAISAINNKPIVVLVNQNTSSAAEILAAALQENNKAVVVGSRTYGKGSVQDTLELLSVPGAAIKLTFATYKTPLK
ncbi:MAG: PDZ domain-containing protein, partial [Alphaproteobacteria bacterium]|nr:PDZ domain-containing protein [Rickettsiales bacterium]